MNSPLAWFGLPDDADEREIKRAYARRLKALRPEDDAVAFQQLHERYRNALAWRQARPLVVEQAALATADADGPEPDDPTGGGPRRDDEPHGKSAPDEPPQVRQPAPRTPPAPVAARPEPSNLHQTTPPPAVPPAEPRREWPRRPGATRTDTPPAGAPHVQPTGRETPAPARMLDPERLAGMFVAYARTCTPAQALAWLNGRQELWSFETKNRTGALLLHALLREPQPIQAPNFDAALEFFGLEGSSSRIDPLQVERLRAHMHERHQLLHRFQPAVQPWADSPAPDPEAVLAWYGELAWSEDQGKLAAALYAQPALNSAEVRDHLAPALLDRLLDQPPALPQEAAALLVRHFGLFALAARRGVDISDLPARLHVRWLARPANRNRLAAQIATPGHRPSPATAARLLRWGSQPFRWWRVLLLCLVPVLPTRLGGALWRTCAGVPARLAGLADMRSAKFWIDAATHQTMTLARLQITAWRCLLLLLGAGAATVVRYRANPAALPADFAMPLVFACIATLGCAYYLLHTSLNLWLRLPEQPTTPRPLLRLAFIPLLCLAGGAVFGFYFVAGEDPVRANLHAHWVLVPALVLAYQRYRGRSAPGKPARQTGRLEAYAFAFVLFMILAVPLATAAAALGFWGWDLYRHRKQVRWRGEPRR